MANRKFRGAWLLSNSGAQVLSAVSGMATNVVYARGYSLSVVGLMGVLSASSALAVMMMDRGVGTWLTRTIARRELTTGRGIAVAAWGAATTVAVLSVVCVAAIIASAPLSEAFSFAVLWLVPFSIASWVFQLALALSQGQQQDHLRASLIAGNAIATLLVTVAVATLVPSANGAAAASLVAYLGVGAAGCWLLSRRARASERQVKPIPFRLALRQSRAFWLSNLLNYTVANADLLVAGAFLRTETVGLYQLARKLAQAVVLPFIASLSLLLGKSSGRSTTEGRRLVSTFWTVSLIVATMCAFMLLALGPIVIPLLFDVEAAEVAPVLVILMLAFLLQLMRDTLSVQANAEGKHFWPIRSGAASLLVGAASFGLYGHYGAVPLAWSLVSAFAAGAVLHLFRYNWSDRNPRHSAMMVASGAFAVVPLLCAGFWLAV